MPNAHWWDDPNSVLVEAAPPEAPTVDTNCYSCGAPTPEPAVTQRIWHNRLLVYCANCSMACAGCQTLHATNNMHRVGRFAERSRVCMSCFEANYATCNHCDYSLSVDSMTEVNSLDGYVRLCEECHNYHANACGSCEEDYYGDNCPGCTEAVHDYSYRPRAIFHAVEKEEPKYYLGFEVEVEGGSRPSSKLPKWVYAKYDGSLDEGFEIVSHPLSPAWIRGHTEEVKKMLADLRSGGFTSFDTETCGMHVHVSRSGFSGTFHLLKWLEMFYRWPAWSLIISERAQEKLNQWARCGASREDIYRKAKFKANEHEDRYTAINLENPDTFEVRIFRGAIDAGRFFKNLQYVEATVEFTRDTSRQKVSPRAFREWVVGQKRRYPDLVKWLERNGHV